MKPLRPGQAKNQKYSVCNQFDRRDCPLAHHLRLLRRTDSGLDRFFTQALKLDSSLAPPPDKMLPSFLLRLLKTSMTLRHLREAPQRDVERRRGNRQHRADRLDPESIFVIKNVSVGASRKFEAVQSVVVPMRAIPDVQTLVFRESTLNDKPDHT